MDAGKNNRITPKFHIGGTQPKKAAPGPQDSPAVQRYPSESVSITGGQAPAIKPEGDAVSTGHKEFKAEAAPKTLSSSSTGMPTEINGALIAGISGTSPKRSFPGLNLHGLNATSLSGVGGDKVLASVNPLKPSAPTRMPTTSLGLVNGIEDTQWITTSGRVIG